LEFGVLLAITAEIMCIKIWGPRNLEIVKNSAFEATQSATMKIPDLKKRSTLVVLIYPTEWKQWNKPTGSNEQRHGQFVFARQQFESNLDVNIMFGGGGGNTGESDEFKVSWPTNDVMNSFIVAKNRTNAISCHTTPNSTILHLQRFPYIVFQSKNQKSSVQFLRVNW